MQHPRQNELSLGGEKRERERRRLGKKEGGVFPALGNTVYFLLPLLDQLTDRPTTLVGRPPYSFSSSSSPSQTREGLSHHHSPLLLLRYLEGLDRRQTVLEGALFMGRNCPSYDVKTSFAM